jgi:hypothetical protein
MGWFTTWAVRLDTAKILVLTSMPVKNTSVLAAILNLNLALISPTVKTAGWYGKPVKTG